jgi:D-alanyl-D-alanine carboxypeptidase
MLAFLPAHDAAADARNASMVIDANTGQVLHASNADAERYPASLTKMMTLYLLFEEIERGRLTLSSPIEISPHAAAAAPSKLGLPVGEKIAVEDAIRALAVKSANDIAVAIAEHLGGSEAAFANTMTERARQLGMTRTIFRNASGLPDRQQVTTARDMLTLALRLNDDFPKLYPFFNTLSFTYRGKTYRTHNSLLRTFPGMDGLKTGYIRASGFNLVSSVRRGNRHLVAAVFGGSTAASRNAEMRALLGRTIPRASPVKTRKPAPKLIARAAPASRPERRAAEVAPPPPIPAPRPVQVAAAAAPEQSRPEIAIARVRPVMMAQQPTPASPAAEAESRPGEPQFLAASAAPAAGRGMAPSTFQQQADNLNRGASSVAPLAWDAPQQSEQRRPPAPTVVASAPAVAPVEAPSARQNAPVNGAFAIQVGAYATAAEAEKVLVLTLERAAGLLGDASPVTAPVQSGSRQLYRARFAGFDQQAAANTCNALRRRQIDCFVARAAN